MNKCNSGSASLLLVAASTSHPAFISKFRGEFPPFRHITDNPSINRRENKLSLWKMRACFGGFLVGHLGMIDVEAEAITYAAAT